MDDMSPGKGALAPLAISTGDPGGVGPEISLRAVVEGARADRCILFGDARSLRANATRLGIVSTDWMELRVGEPLPAAVCVGVCDVGHPWTGEAIQHAPSAAGGAAALAALDAAIGAARAGHVRALVTAPMSKAAVNLAGRAFTGHTEHLAAAAGLQDDDVTMMFLGPRLNVGLVTTHLSIARAPAAITQRRVLRTIRHMAEAVQRLRPNVDRMLRVLVAGLNPHAGEGGLFGDEEPRSIAPAIEAARHACRELRISIEGPIGAETAFRETSAGHADAVVAMLHDQATIASKLLDWTQAVNVTWGLPFVRTSVDHGVAYDAAHRGQVDAQGMISALAMAQRLAGAPRA